MRTIISDPKRDRYMADVSIIMEASCITLVHDARYVPPDVPPPWFKKRATRYGTRWVSLALGIDAEPFVRDTPPLVQRFYTEGPIRKPRII